MIAAEVEGHMRVMHRALHGLLGIHRRAPAGGDEPLEVREIGRLAVTTPVAPGRNRRTARRGVDLRRSASGLGGPPISRRRRRSPDFPTRSPFACRHPTYRSRSAGAGPRRRESGSAEGRAVAVDLDDEVLLDHVDIDDRQRDRQVLVDAERLLLQQLTRRSPPKVCAQLVCGVGVLAASRILRRGEDDLTLGRPTARCPCPTGIWNRRS